MLDLSGKAIGLLLAAGATAAASMPNSGDMGYHPEYASMGARTAAPVEIPEMPAHRVKRHENRLSRRQATDGNEDLDLVAEQSWYWGQSSQAVAPGSDNPIVNVTGYVDGSHQRYLSAERFSDVVSSIDCPTGEIAFTLSSQESFAQAQEKWSWINTGNHSVFIVLERDTCGNEKRQPYLAQNVVYNAGSRRATFKAAISNWVESAPGYHVIADTEGILSGQNTDGTLQRRQLSFSETAAVNLDHDFSGNIFTAPDVLNSSLEFNLYCKSCSTTGTLNFRFEGSLELNPFSDNFGLTASAEVKPSGVGATIELGFRLGGELTSPLRFNPSLQPVGLPGGISAGPVVIGPNLVVSYLAELSSVSAEVELSVGTKITIDDNAVARAVIRGNEENTFDGWTPSFEGIGPDLSASVSVSAQTGPQISVELSGTVFDFGLSAGLLLSAPSLQATLSADVDTAGGICGIEDATAGASIDIGLAAEFSAFGGPVNPDNKFPNQFNLFSTSTALFSACSTFLGGAPTPAPASATPDISEIGLSFIPISTSAPAAPAATGRTTTFFTNDCTGSSGSNGWTSGVCTPIGLNAPYTSGTITGDALDTISGCLVRYYLDSECTAQVGPAFQPFSGECRTFTEPEAPQIEYVKVDC